MSLRRINPVAQSAALDTFASPHFMAFTEALSKSLMQSSMSRDYPDLVALGYWLRPANIKRIVSAYQPLQLRPVGHVFHAAPGNVDSLFVYAGIISLMCGNINTIRLSNKAGGSAELLCDIIQSLSQAHPEVTARFQLVRSDRDSAELIALQQHIDARVLWGSNEGIQVLRQIPMPAHARELVFAHKLSFAVIGIEAVLHVDENELNQLCESFARDNLTFAQQACSSAKVLIWNGDREKLTAAQERFWQAFATYLGTEAAEQKYQFTDSERYQALNNAQDMAMAGYIEGSFKHSGVLRAWAEKVSPKFEQAHGGAGLFVESHVSELRELNRFLTPAYQTMSYWGVDHVEEWLKHCLVGVDRIVPVGQALNFDTVWDGMDLVRVLGRKH